MFFIVILISVLFSPIVYAVTPTEVYCPDEALNHALHDVLGTSYSEPLLDTQLMMLTGQLNLMEKGIRDITGLEYLKGIDFFMLANNEIEELTEEFCQMVADKNVQSINFAGNKLGSLPSNLRDSHLISLELSANEFYSIPSFIAEITTLESLGFSGNRISSLPPWVADMPNIKYLYISYNRIENIPSSFNNSNWVYFDCNYNFLDISPTSSNTQTLGSMTVSSSLRYENQLKKLTGLSVEYIDTGVVKFTWDPGTDIVFNTLEQAEMTGTTILQDGEYIDRVGPEVTEFTVSGLEVGREYEFSFSYDYRVTGVQFVYSFDGTTRCYTQIKATPQPFAAPTPEPTVEITQTASVTPAETETLAQESTQPELEKQTTEDETEFEITDEQAEDSGGGIADWVIILIVILGLIFIAGIVLIIYFVNHKKDNKNPKTKDRNAL